MFVNPVGLRSSSCVLMRAVPYTTGRAVPVSDASTYASELDAPPFPAPPPPRGLVPLFGSGFGGGVSGRSRGSFRFAIVYCPPSVVGMLGNPRKLTRFENLESQ